MADVSARLRRARADLAFAVAIADIAGLWPLERVCGTLSDFADAAIEAALQACALDTLPAGAEHGFSVLALGKLGARALNYSSDVDLILLYDPSRPVYAAAKDADRLANRLAQRFVGLLQNVTAEGYCLRVDLRLRPDPNATPIALPLGAAESYYQSAALPWERAAFLKARPTAGDRAAGAAFLKRIEPFIWRRSLDYTVVRDIRDMSAMVRNHFDQEGEAGSGFDVKRGQGGIRDVEFYVQIEQMIFGGREPGLRAAATLDGLERLAHAGKIGPAERAQLEASYRFLRAIEHRLQMVEDAQTHRIPDRADELARFAAFAGFATPEALLAAVKAHADPVSTLYDTLTGGDGATVSLLPYDRDTLEAVLSARGFRRPADAAAAMERWRSARYRATRSERARALLEQILPPLIDALGAADDPDAALLRFDGFLAALPAGVQLFALLEHSTALLRFLARILAMAEPVAQALVRAPDLLDIVLDPGFLAPPPPLEALKDQLARRTARLTDYEAVLDEVRRWVAELRFQIAVQLLEGRASVAAAQASASDVADAALERLAEATVASFAIRHGRTPGAELVVLALGRYGGRALSLSSDLDLVFLFTGSFSTESDGPAPLAATSYFNRLSQRVVAALSAPTASGVLYQVDTRLRPSGEQGLLAVSLDSFADYQRAAAWTWEHLALTRARAVFGSQAARAATTALVRDIIATPRDVDALVAAARAMRADMDRHLPPASAWDVKRIKGGLIDLEFAVQALTLGHAAAHPEIAHPELPLVIEALGAIGALPDGAAGRLRAALDTLDTILTLLRLGQSGAAADAAPSAAIRPLLARALSVDGFAGVEAALEAARAEVFALWRMVFGAEHR